MSAPHIELLDLPLEICVSRVESGVTGRNAYSCTVVAGETKCTAYGHTAERAYLRAIDLVMYRRGEQR